MAGCLRAVQEIVKRIQEEHKRQKMIQAIQAKDMRSRI